MKNQETEILKFPFEISVKSSYASSRNKKTFLAICIQGISSQLIFTCSKPTKESLQKDEKHVQSNNKNIKRRH